MHELLHYGMLTPVELFSRSVGDEVPFVQNDKLISNSAGTGNIMGYDHQSRVSLRFELEQQVVNLRRSHRIQASARFVH
jgi:hypothetical protein